MRTTSPTRIKTRKRWSGTTIAAAALSVALISPIVQPLAVAQENFAQPVAEQPADPYGAIYSPGKYWGSNTVSGSALFYDQFPGDSNGNTAGGKGEANGYGKALPAVGSGLGPNFVGAIVYAQWFEKSDRGMSGNSPAVASPIYKTTVQPDGTWSIEMRPYTSADGKYREFLGDYNSAAGGRGQKIRVWVDGYDRNEFKMLRGYGERVAPDGMVADTTGGASWAAADRVEGAHQLFVRRPKAEQLLGPESGWRQVAEAEIAAGSSRGGSVYGKAYWNLNQGVGNLTNRSIVGPSGDRKIKGLKVVGAYLADHAVVAAQNYVKENQDLLFQGHSLRGVGWDVQDELKLQNWINEQIKTNPDWIAERVVTETNGNGEYRLQFNGTYGIGPGRPGKVDPNLAGTVAPSSEVGYFSDNRISLRDDVKHVNWDWMFIDTPDLPQGTSNMGAWRGNVWQGLTSTAWGVSNLAITEPAGQFDMRGLQAALLTPNYNIQTWDMALMPNRIKFAIDRFDSYTSPARSGDTTYAATGGLPGYDMNARYQVEWTDSNGRVLNTCAETTAASDGSLPNCDIIVPSALNDMTTYVATLYGIDENGDRIRIAQDSFTALTGTASEVSPKYTETYAKQGVETKTEAPTFVDAKTGEPVAVNDARLNGAKFALDQASLPEGWAASIDENTGVITVTPGQNGRDGQPLKDGDVENLAVRVTYPDGTRNGVNAPIVIGEKPLTADTVQPEYGNTLVVPGTPAKAEPKFKDNGGQDVAKPEGAKFAIPEDYVAPEGYTVDINAETGVVTVEAPAKPNDETAEELQVLVKVTYSDDSTDDVTAPFQLDTDGDGTPDVTDEDDDNDGITDQDEKDKGTNPKDNNSAPTTIADIPNQNGTVGKAIDPVKVVVTDAPAGSTVEVTGLPEGLKYNPETGEITGTPTKAGTSEVKVVVKDKDGKPVTGADGKPVEKTFTFTVADKPFDGPKIVPGATTDEVPADGNPKTLDDKITGPTDGLTGEVKDKDGNPIPGSKVEITPNGEIKVTVPQGTDPQPGTVTIKDKDGKNLGDIDIKITDKTAPSIDNVKSDDKKITGTGDRPNEDITVTFPDGTEAKTKTDGNNKFEVPVPADKSLENGNTIKAKDGNGNESERIVIGTDPDVPDGDLNGQYTVVYPESYIRPGGKATSKVPTVTRVIAGNTYRNQPLPDGVALTTDYPSASIEGNRITLEAPADAQPGSRITVPVTVEYPDNTTTTVDAVFIVENNILAERYNPAYETGKSVIPGATTRVHQSGEPNLPAWTDFTLPRAKNDLKGWTVSVHPETGTITATAPRDNAEPLEVTVNVSYADGSSEDVTATIGVDKGATDAARNEPTYPAEKVMTSEVTKIPMTTKVPANTTFEMANTGGLKASVNKETGELQVTPPHNAPPQATYTVQVKVTYPDQSTEIVSIPVTTNSQANENDAHWNDVVAPRDAVVVAPQTAGLPEGTTYAVDATFADADWDVSINGTTGEITVKNRNAAAGARLEIPVVITYKDGSQERETVTARAVDNAAATEKVVYPPLTLDAGRSATLTPNQVEGATFTLVENQPVLTTTIDASTGVITVTADADTVGGVRTIPVGIQFGDGSTTTVNATVTVKEGEAPVRDPWESVAPNSSGKNSANGWIALVVGILGAIGGLGMLIFNNRDLLARFGIHF